MKTLRLVPSGGVQALESPVRMISSCFTSLELLEQRIAPAGLVTATFTDGVLTISGADGQDHDVEIVKTGKTTFSVGGTGTDINESGQTVENFRGKLKNVVIEGGEGADTFELTKLKPLKSLSFDGAGGVDSLSTTKLRVAKGGSVEINLGAESGTVHFSGDRTTILGELNIDLGGGGEVDFLSAETIVKGNVVVTGGAASDSFLITGQTTLFKGNLTFLGGAGDDAFSATGESLTVKKIVTMDGEEGTNQFLFSADKNVFGKKDVAGLVDLKLGVGPGTISFLGNSTSVLGELNIDLGASGGLAHLGSDVTTVRDNVQVTGGAGNDTLKLEGRTSIGKNLSYVGDAGDDVLNATGGLLAVKGATTMDGGSGASVFDVQVVNLALAGLTVTGGTANDTVRIIADGTISGDVVLDLGLDGIGPSSVILQSAADRTDGLTFGGDVTIDMLGATVDFLTITNIQVAKSFVAQTGENVSTVAIVGLNAAGNFKLRTGAGADVVNIDNISVQDLDIDTEAGADELRIERNALYNGPSQVLGIATILTGIGADQIRIGDSTGNLKVMFKDSMTLDAGDGANMRNDILGTNSFKSTPTIIATGGTLTQTEAV